MRHQHGAFYLIRRNKWIWLSRDYADALRIYAGMLAPSTDKLPDLMDRWLSNKKIAPKTRKTYTVVANVLKKAFADFTPQDVKPAHLYQLIAAKSVSNGMAAHYRSVMVGTMQLAVEEGLIDRNPIREVKQFSVPARDRYLTDEEYAAIWEKATPTLRAIMDVAYLTGQRIGDVLAIRHSDIGKEGITFVQQKTKARLCVAWSADLEQAVANAKALHTSLRGMTLFHSRKGTPFSYNTVRTLWDRACTAARVENAHMHDIRAKAATDAKKQGQDSKALLGHKSEQVHLRYIREKETPVVQPVRLSKN